MIDWERSAEMNGMMVEDLKAYFGRFPSSNKKVVAICEGKNCGHKVRILRMVDYCDLCFKCSMNTKEYRKKRKVISAGLKHSDRTKEKMSATRIGENHPFFNHKHSDKTKEKISRAKTGSKVNEKTKKKISCSLQGIPIESFIGFTNEQNYCPKFNEPLKTKIRNNYNNCDYMSGLHKSICNKNWNPDVHHVNYDKDCGCNGNRCKLIPLSKSNHSRTNINRLFWNRLFIYSLEIDEWYYGENEWNQPVYNYVFK